MSQSPPRDGGHGTADTASQHFPRVLPLRGGETIIVLTTRVVANFLSKTSSRDVPLRPPLKHPSPINILHPYGLSEIPSIGCCSLHALVQHAAITKHCQMKRKSAMVRMYIVVVVGLHVSWDLLLDTLVYISACMRRCMCALTSSDYAAKTQCPAARDKYLRTGPWFVQNHRKHCLKIEHRAYIAISQDTHSQRTRHSHRKLNEIQCTLHVILYRYI